LQEKRLVELFLAQIPGENRSHLPKKGADIGQVEESGGKTTVCSKSFLVRLIARRAVNSSKVISGFSPKTSEGRGC